MLIPSKQYGHVVFVHLFFFITLYVHRKINYLEEFFYSCVRILLASVTFTQSPPKVPSVAHLRETSQQNMTAMLESQLYKYEVAV